MKSILLLTLLVLFPCFVFADDSISWRNYELDSEYDYEKEELQLEFSVYSESEPESFYRVQVPFGDLNCLMDLEYINFYLKGSCNLYIDPSLVRKKYETKLVINNEFKQEVYDAFIRVELRDIKEYLLWGNFSAVAGYNTDRGKLSLALFLSGVLREPDEEYSVSFFLEGKEYKKPLTYDTDSNRLFLEIETGENSSVLRKDINISYEIYNQEKDSVHKSRIKLRAQEIIDDKNIDFDASILSGTYKEKDQKLEIDFILENISQKPQKNYTLTLELSDVQHTERLIYDVDLKRLLARFEINISNDEVSRVITPELRIIDNYSDIVHDTKHSTRIDYIYREDNFDWSKIQYKNVYDLEAELLEFTAYLENISNEPQMKYLGEIEILGKDHVEVFRYDEDLELLYISVQHRIKKADIQREYLFEVDIEDEDAQRKVNEDILIPITVKNILVPGSDSGSLGIDFSNSKIELHYSSENQYLHIQFSSINRFLLDEDFIFFTQMFGDDDTKSVKLKYDNETGKYFGQTNYYIPLSEVSNSYRVTSTVYDSYDRELFTLLSQYRLIFDADINKVITRKVDPTLEKNIEGFVRKVYLKNDTAGEAETELKNIMLSLSSYGEKKTRYKILILDINSVIERMLEEVSQ